MLRREEDQQREGLLSVGSVPATGHQPRTRRSRAVRLPHAGTWGHTVASSCPGTHFVCWQCSSSSVSVLSIWSLFAILKHAILCPFIPCSLFFL